MTTASSPRARAGSLRNPIVLAEGELPPRLRRRTFPAQPLPSEAPLVLTLPRLQTDERGQRLSRHAYRRGTLAILPPLAAAIARARAPVAAIVCEPELGLALEAVRPAAYRLERVIAVRAPCEIAPGLDRGHLVVVVWLRGRRNLHAVQIPRPRCPACGRTSADQGGHTDRDPHRYLSDVWTDLDARDGHLGQIGEGRLAAVLAGEDREIVVAVDVTGVDRGRQGCRPRLPDVKPAAGAVSMERDERASALYLGSWTDVLPRIPSASIELCLLDPPYNLAKPYAADANDELPPDEYDTVIDELLAQATRVLRPGGSLVLITTPQHAARAALYAGQTLSLVASIAWDAPSTPRGMLVPAHYAVLWYRRGRASEIEAPTFAEAPHLKTSISARYCRRRGCARDRGRAPVEALTDLITDTPRRMSRRRASNAGEAAQHPCVLPPDLPRRLILLTTNPGDVVADPSTGTGVSLRCAKDTGRAFVGVELSERWATVAMEALELDGFSDVATLPAALEAALDDASRADRRRRRHQSPAKRGARLRLRLARPFWTTPGRSDRHILEVLERLRALADASALATPARSMRPGGHEIVVTLASLARREIRPSVTEAFTCARGP